MIQIMQYVTITVTAAVLGISAVYGHSVSRERNRNE